MCCELFPWSNPVLLRLVSKKLPEKEKFTSIQTTLVATIVHNAGIYNSIIAGGLLWAAAIGDPAIAAAVARVLLLGAGVAGAFGTVTLKSPLTVVQARSRLGTKAQPWAVWTDLNEYCGSRKFDPAGFVQ
jgi:uncharacterized membrane protein